MWKTCTAALAAALLLVTPPAYACATCACGDPTLTSMDASAQALLNVAASAAMAPSP